MKESGAVMASQASPPAKSPVGSAPPTVDPDGPGAFIDDYAQIPFPNRTSQVDKQSPGRDRNHFAHPDAGDHHDLNALLRQHRAANQPTSRSAD
jgi:hypothetical protein